MEVDGDRKLLAHWEQNLGSYNNNNNNNRGAAGYATGAAGYAPGAAGYAPGAAGSAPGQSKIKFDPSSKIQDLCF